MRARITGGFWAERQALNTDKTLHHIWRQCKETGRIDAFRLRRTADAPHIFWDSDVAKWLEAACASLGARPDPELRALVDETALLIAGAQQPDGYLNTHFSTVEQEKRWTNLRDWHELYAAGHLMEAAVEHHALTGGRGLLDPLFRYGEHIARTFGREEGKKPGYCGHPEIELALVRLYRATGEARWLDLARYFVDQRGAQPHYFDREARARGEDPAKYWAGSYAYCQAHAPVREQKEVVGHAVRAFYLLSAMADLALITGDRTLAAACQAQWRDVTRTKMYVTGGIGPSARNEGFTTRYDLPNEGAYAETCASIALILFSHRMLALRKDGEYADVLEQALYNGFLSGVGLDGVSFHYVNPLASAGGHHRQPWFSCACCPPNVARLVAELGDYIYEATPRAVYVHLYASSETSLEIGGGRVTIRQDTGYPWSGEVRITLASSTPTRFDLYCRVPGWATRHVARVNGKTVGTEPTRGYLKLGGRWQDGDEIELRFPMPVERLVAHPRVVEDAGRVALRRGPLVYCVEQCDVGVDARTLLLPAAARLEPWHAPGLLGGVTVLEGSCRAPREQGWEGRLYRRAGKPVPEVRTTAFRAIPYYAWDNRKPGTMAVWLRQA